MAKLKDKRKLKKGDTQILEIKNSKGEKVKREVAVQEIRQEVEEIKLPDGTIGIREIGARITIYQYEGVK